MDLYLFIQHWAIILTTRIKSLLHQTIWLLSGDLTTIQTGDPTVKRGRNECVTSKMNFYLPQCTKLTSKILAQFLFKKIYTYIKCLHFSPKKGVLNLLHFYNKFLKLMFWVMWCSFPQICLVSVTSSFLEFTVNMGLRNVVYNIWVKSSEQNF